MIYKCSGAGIRKKTFREKLPEKLALTFDTGRDVHSVLKLKPAEQGLDKINIIQNLKYNEREFGQNIS